MQGPQTHQPHALCQENLLKSDSQQNFNFENKLSITQRDTELTNKEIS